MANDNFSLKSNVKEETERIKAKSLKCYNSFSCVASVLVIVFILGSIMWDLLVTKPQIRQSIAEIKIELKGIRSTLNERHIGQPKEFAPYFADSKSDSVLKALPSDKK